MVGLPPFLTLKFFHDIYPCDIRSPNTHHGFALALSIYLLTVGPNLFKKKADKVKKD